jgi:ATP dependent DNA ligase C terminal region
VTRAIQAEPHDQATSCRGNAEGLHTLVQAAGALVASGHPARGLRRRTSSTSSPKLVHCRVRVAPHGSRGSRRIAGVWFALVVGWTDPEGRRPYLGALLLAYYDPDGRLVYAGRVGSGINDAELERLWRRLQPLATSKMPLEVPPPRSNRFGSPLVLSRVPWIRPELVAEVKYLTWRTALSNPRRSPRDAPPKVRFAADSALEEDGFELSVPGHETVKPSWETALLSRKRKRICWGTESSNPPPSTGESAANSGSRSSEQSADGLAASFIAKRRRRNELSRKSPVKVQA